MRKKVKFICIFSGIVALLGILALMLVNSSTITAFLIHNNENQVLASVYADEGPIVEQLEETLEPQADVLAEECDHKWVNGVCELCGQECEHAVHDERYHRCIECGELVTHSFISGRCAICGATPKYSYNVLPDTYYEPCEEQGEVQTIRYQTKLYRYDSDIEREAMVYLPYGYDEAKPYNVLVLVHGLGGSADNMITRSISYDGKTYRMSNLYDRMIMEKDCKPFIGVSINTRQGSAELMYDQIAQELRNDLLPYIVRHYSTYAANDSEEAIIDARQHFGMAGFSMGSIYTYNTGMARALDVFGNFGAFGGNSEPKYVAKAANEYPLSEYPIYCLFSGAGVSDGGQRQQFDAYQWIYESTPRLKTGINSFNVTPDGTHEWKVFVTEMYNALQIMFQDLE